MTVGVAAAAGRNPKDRRADRGYPTEAIVLVADRRLTYDDNSVTESWVPKIRGMIGKGSTVRTTWSALFAGDGSVIDEVKARVVADPEATRLHDDENWPPLEEVIRVVQRAAEAVYKRGYDEYVYRPFGLTRPLVLERSADLADLPDQIMDRIVDRGLEFDTDEIEFGCELALCGFDERFPFDIGPNAGGRSAIIHINPKGDVTRSFDTGFCAIGQGSGTATARLELLRYRPWMDLGRVLYFALDAKLTAERVASVGPSTDAWVLLPHRALPVYVNDDAPGLIEALAAVRGKELRSSIFQRGLPDDGTPLPDPPADWSDCLWDFVRRCYEDSLTALSSIEREPPSWRLQTGVPQ